jgi:hypothetical protein
VTQSSAWKDFIQLKIILRSSLFVRQLQVQLSSQVIAICRTPSPQLKELNPFKVTDFLAKCHQHRETNSSGPKIVD